MSIIGDRTWLLTSTTYGSWLPGDERGFVSPVRDTATGRYSLRNLAGTPCEHSIPGLAAFAAGRSGNLAISLNGKQAAVVTTQFLETATYRRWRLLACAVMATHFHALLTVSGDPDPATLLRDLKSYASRALNRQWSKPASGTWWTQSGSRRKKTGEPAIRAAVAYVWNQPKCLARHADAQIPHEWLERQSQGERPA